MEQFKFITDYMNDNKYRKSFNELALKTFCLDFDEWFKKGFLDDNYINYSFLSGDKIVSNVSINKFNIIYNGKINKAIQLGTVMTDEAYRNNGLIKKLMDIILKEYEAYDLIYLFANKNVLDFYPKFGFKKVLEGKYEMDISNITKTQLKSNIIKLELENEEHKKIVEKISKNRVPLSQKLCAIKDKWPLYIHCNYEFKEDLYYLKDKNVIVIFRRKNNIITLYDILSENNFDLDEIIEKIIQEDDEKIIFEFMPESNKYSIDFKLNKDTVDTLFVLKGKETLCDGVVFPITSHT
ncbi:GNAT family N-acetyltransferase [Clostridium sp. C2-6-12]|uniref:GNAT family N-acetyltransferase n=1 Tax=Clostridium sp. C2-6-12 TaxID=2698832 RepID=UPI001370E3E7|nr:GNAT family N-acetyltransferase [Clostridium sp. C2-6-12]